MMPLTPQGNDLVPINILKKGRKGSGQMANISLRLMGGKTDEDVSRNSFLEGMKSNT